MHRLLPFALAAVLPAQQFTLKETAGLRRFNFPVQATLETARAAGALRLFDEATPIPAQFTQMAPGVVEIDFAASMLPWEVRNFRVEAGVADPVASDALGVSLETRALVYRVRHANGLMFDVSRDLLGLFRDVQSPSQAYVAGGSHGLGVVDRTGASRRVGGIANGGEAIRFQVVKSGPIMAELRAESVEAIGGSTVTHQVDLMFPRTKSWAEVHWTIDDPGDAVEAMYARLNLDLDDPPILDFGAGNYVYVGLQSGQSAEMRAGQRPDGSMEWRIESSIGSYASGVNAHVEGWAHVMDLRRALAFAIADFGRSSRDGDALSVIPGARLEIRRDGMGGRRKTLRFWMHVVGMPVQRNAATSAQSIQAPLLVEWK